MFLSSVMSPSYASLLVSEHIQSPGLTIQEYDLIRWNIVLIHHANSLFAHIFKNQQKMPPKIDTARVIILRLVMMQDRPKKGVLVVLKTSWFGSEVKICYSPASINFFLGYCLTG